MIRDLLSVLLLLAFAAPAAAEPLRVVTTTPDLASLAREIGGELVAVRSLTRGPQDAHFLEPRPSFIRQLADADLYLQIGAGLETGWAPVLVRSARNRAVQPGRPGYVDVSTGVDLLYPQAARIDRSLGDLHAQGNPHYLLDPENGRRAAALIRDRMSALRPDSAATFAANFADFESRLDAALARWTERMAAHPKPPVVVDHDMWPYFARRFGLDVVATLEPLPGISPTTRHLVDVAAEMEVQGVRVILSSPYFNRSHAERVAEKTGARIVPMAHQVGGRPDTEDYLTMLDHNVGAVAEALAAGS